MKRGPEPMECVDEAAKLLPWFVNGTLSNADAARVAAHLKNCETCRVDADEQGNVQELLRATPQTPFSSHAGLRKLMSRIDESQRENRITRGTEIATRSRWRSSGNSVRWLAAAVVIQGVAVTTIAGVQLLRQPPADAAPYRTLTSVQVERPRLRVAFVPTTTLGELQELLRANELVAVAGPTDAGIFTLGLRSSAAGPDVQGAVLARLRADPRVRFAEPLAPDAPPR